MKFIVVFGCFSIMANISTILGEEEWETWSLDKLEKEMSPSRWNPTKSPEIVIDEYRNNGLVETEKARQTIPNMLNVSYGQDTAEKLDIYGTDLPDNVPIFIFIHGGYWQGGNKDISAGVALNVHELGIKTIVLGYTLAPSAKINQIQMQLINALKYITSHYPNSKLILGGHSAGAQLSSFIFHMEDENLFPEIYDRLVGMVLISGIYDLCPLVPTYVNDALKMTREEAESLSPLRKQIINPQFEKEKIQIKFLYGNYDSPEFKRQSLAYKANLENKFLASSKMCDDDDHFTIVQSLGNSSSESGQEVNEFLRQLKSTAASKGVNAKHAVLPHYLLGICFVFFYLSFF